MSWNDCVLKFTSFNCLPCLKLFECVCRETRLTEAIDDICERLLQYSVHAERPGSLRYAKVRTTSAPCWPIQSSIVEGLSINELFIHSFIFFILFFFKFQLCDIVYLCDEVTDDLFPLGCRAPVRPCRLWRTWSRKGWRWIWECRWSCGTNRLWRWHTWRNRWAQHNTHTSVLHITNSNAGTRLKPDCLSSLRALLVKKNNKKNREINK